MDDLEDGELTEDSSASVKEANKFGSSVWRSTMLSDCSGNVVPVQSPRTVNARRPAKLRRNSSSDSDSDKGQLSHSDDDFGPEEKRWHGSEICPVSDNSAIKRPKGRNNIWGCVLEDQSLAQDLSGWFGMNKKVNSERDVEAYDYTNALKDDLVNCPEICPQPASLVHDAGHFDVSDLCDKETFGTGTTTSHVNISLHNDSSDDQSDDMVDRINYAEETCTQKLKIDGCGRAMAKSRLGVRKVDQMADPRVTESDDPVSVGTIIHEVLQEPQHMKDTFVRVATVLGSATALDILRKTEDIERSGGLKIMNGERRRTPGGVYLFLLKDNESVSKESYKEIFKTQFDEHKRSQKESKKRRWIDRSAKMKQLSSNEQQHPLCDGREQLVSAPIFGGACIENYRTQPAAVGFDDCFAMNDTDEPVNIELDL